MKLTFFVHALKTMSNSEAGYLPLSINLQPWRAQKRKQGVFRITVVLACGMLFVALAIWWQYQQFLPQVQRLEQAQADLREQLGKDKSRQQNLKKSSIQFTTLANWHRLYLAFTSLQLHLPLDVRIQKLELVKKLLIEGNSQHRQSLNQLIEGLASQPGIAKVTIREVSERDSIWNFSLQIEFDHYQLAQMFVAECEHNDCLER